MYTAPSRGLPSSLGDVAVQGEDSDASLSGLAKRVSAYLARVVGALADFEDRLLFEDGFFAREEHFEAQIDSLRREFESNRRAQVRIAQSFCLPEPSVRHTPVIKGPPDSLTSPMHLRSLAIRTPRHRFSSRAPMRWGF